MNTTSPPALSPAVERRLLTQALADTLEGSFLSDYAPNGLQVEGKSHVRKLVTGVTASLALIEGAVGRGADAILVHHGLFWRSQDRTLTGWLKERVARVLLHDINLYAYHLPLDAHKSLGNNAQLARVLGLTTESYFGDSRLGCLGRKSDGGSFATAADLAALIALKLGREPVVVGSARQPLERIAWCSGGAQDWFEAAIEVGAQAFITGEISEPQAHIARECGVVFLACGHHATERYGAPALGEHIASTLGIEHEFIDIDNPA